MTRRPARSSRRAGFTLIEALIALSILALVITNVTMVTRSSTQAYESGTSISSLDMQLDRTMDRIALALMAARRNSITPSNSAPLWTPQLSYDQSLGFEDGNEIVSDTERIQLVPDQEQVVWKERPDSAEERKVVWTNWVREYFRDESFNGLDDDANGLVDEAGLSFTVDGSRVTIRLTLERQGPDHEVMSRTQETTVTCRN